MLSGPWVLFELRYLIIFLVSSAENVSVDKSLSVRCLTSEGRELLLQSFSKYYLTCSLFYDNIFI